MDLKLAQRFLPYAAIAIITILFSLWYRRSRRCRAKSGRSNGLEDDETEVSSPPVREDGFQYDVFLSFRGPDTRKTFADLLYEQLKDKGIITFIDSEKLEKGQKLQVLVERIQRSKIFVPIFSRGYADSKWCLKEIAKMVECKRVILPVFVDVEPADVRHQTGPFKSAFRKHRKNKDIDEGEVSNWSNALKAAGSASGYTLATTEGYLGKLTQQIVKRILSEVYKTSKLDVAEHPVGLDSRIQDVIKMLETEAQDDARMVGIWGMGGLGKTTLSKAVYSEISSRFDARSFISNVREAAERPSGLASLQKQLLDDVFNEKDVTISNTSDGLGKIKEQIRAKKVLLVLDDVNDASQINELVGQLEWFCSGSRIIITTREKRVLTLARVKQNHVHELKGLDDIQSLELFSWHAFGKKEPDAKFAVLSKEVASTAAGLPLALKIFGSLFFDYKTIEDWQDMSEKLKEDLHKDIYQRLRISFDVLDRSEKEVFLDIACFFVGQETKRATLMWKACGFFPAIAINQLIHKSLVSINDEGEFEMHDHVRDMGRKIVQVKAEESRKYSRLWKDDETVAVLQKKRGTEDVEAIRMGSEDSVSVDVDDLAAMSQLRMLLLQDVTLKGGYEHFPRKLKWLKWSSQALEKFPSSLHLQGFNQLKVLDLSGCRNLSTCPDFASMIHLEMLSFGGCWSMSELHPSIGLLKCLTHLSLRECRSLKELPQEVRQLTKLQEFDLNFCSKITTLPSLKQHLLGELKVLKLRCCDSLTMCPDFMGMPCLEILDFEGCEKMSELHPSIGHLKSLTNLKLSHCKSLKEVPQEVWQLSSLLELDFSGCSKITALPSQVQNAESSKQPLLESLDLSDCSNLIKCPEFTCMPHLQSLSFRGCEKITKLDPSIGQLEKLTKLDLFICKSLRELPQEIGQLTSLEQLTLEGCSSLEEVPQEIWQLTSLTWLNFSGCSKIIALPSQVQNADSLKLPLLERLFLSNCSDLIRCPDFTSMPHLQRLSFRGCKKITKLDPSIGQLEKLTELDLDGCRSLKELPQEIGQLTSLKELRLGGCCSLKEVPQEIGQLTSLEWLGVSDCSSLEKVHQEIWQLTSLTSLNFSDCSKITALPSQVQNADSLKQPLLESLYLSDCSNLTKCPEFTCMPHLESLSFGGCEKITKLDPSIGQLEKLTELDWDGCRSLKELPQEIGQLTSLKELRLRGCCSLKEVPQEIGQLTSLKKLILTDCSSLKEVPQEIGQLTSLERLCLRNCSSLKEVPQEVWQLTSLTSLDFFGCSKITALPSQVENAESSKQPLLESLDLSDCSNLTKCPELTCVPHLQRLSFWGCKKITKLDPSIGQLEKLTELDLYGCESLKELPQEIGQLTSLKELTLEGCSSLKEVPSLPCSLYTLHAADCHQLESIEDVSSLKEFEDLDLRRCIRLEEIPGIEQLNCLKYLLLGGCRRLADSLFERVQEANFQHLRSFFIPGRLINDGSSDPQSIDFILPKQFYFGLLFLYVDQSSLDNICSELENSNAASTLPDKSVASANEVMQPADCQLGGSVVRLGITTDEGQFPFPTCINGWDKNRRLPMATFARDSELMMMAKQGKFKGNGTNDAQRRGMMEMRVSIDGCILLHGDLLTFHDEYPDDEDSDEDPHEDSDDDQDKILDACRVGDNIVLVKFGELPAV